MNDGSSRDDSQALQRHVHRAHLRRTLPLAVTCLLAFVTAAHGWSDKPDVGEFDLRVWKIEDGVPENSITSIAQTSDGYVWIGTFGGLARFDGVRFAVFDTANTEALDTNRILSLLPARNGDLWIGTENGGVVRLRDGVFSSYRSHENAPRGKVFSIVEDWDGAIWFGGANLVRYADETFQRVALAEGMSGANAVRSLHVDSDNSLWIATDAGVGRWRAGQWQVFTTGDGLPLMSGQFVGQDPHGTLWAVGTDWLALLQDDRAILTTSRGGPPDKIYAATVDRRGNHWIACREGLLRARALRETDDRAGVGKLFELALPRRFTGPGGVRSVFEDREGNIWVGTNGRGLLRLRKALFTSISLPGDIHYKSARFLTADAGGGLWVWFGGQVRRLMNGRWSMAPQLAHMKNMDSSSSGPGGILWLAHDERWLSRFAGGELTRYEHRLGHIESILESSGGDVFLGGSNTLSVFRDERITTMTVRDGLPPAGGVGLLTESKDGTIWAARDEAVTGYRDGEFVHYTTADGLPAGEIRSMHMDDEGNLWIATYGMGLARLRGGKFTRYTTAEGLPDNSLGKILEDDDGNLWINSIRGVFRVALKELNAFAAGRMSLVNCRLLRTGGGNNAGGVRTHDQKLWFPTIDAMVGIDPRDFETSDLAPLVAIEGVAADGLAIDRGDHGRTLRVPPGRGDLEIQYAGLSFVEPENVLFRYMLQGYDEDWIEAGTRRTAIYTSIPPDEYRFRVIARNADGVWSETEATVAVTILPHFYQTTWFLVLCVFGVAGTALIGVGIRRRNAGRRYAILQAEVNRSKTAEVALRDVEQRLRLHLTNTPLAVIEWNLDYEVVAWNRSAQDIFGYSADEAIGRHIVGLLVTENWRPRVTKVWDDLMAGHTIVRPAKRNITADGRVIFCDWYSTPLINKDGAVFGVASLAMDVSEREHAAEALRISEERFDLSARGTADGLWDRKITTGEEWWSSQFRELIGFDQQEMAASYEAWASLLHPDDREHALEILRRHLEEREPYDVEFRMRTGSGEYRWFRSRGAAIRDDEGTPVRMVGAVQDIHDRKRAEERQKLLLRELDHRVKNNLAAVCALAQLMAQSTESPREFAVKFEKRIAAMAKVHEVLTSGHWESVDLSELVRLVLSPYTGPNGQVAWSGPPIRIDASAAQPLAMALHELATNAVKHGALSPQAGIVEVKWRHADVRTVVLDWTESLGAPISAPERFGLGLQLVNGFVEKDLGGRFRMDFNQAGLTCEMQLPCCQQSE